MGPFLNIHLFLGTMNIYRLRILLTMPIIIFGTPLQRQGL